MMLAGMVAGGLLIALAGALRHWRGVNATISSLLLTYIVLGVFNYPGGRAAAATRPA